MTALVISGLVCLLLAVLLYRHFRDDHNDGDFGIVIPVLFLAVLGTVLLGVAFGVHLWRSAWGP